MPNHDLAKWERERDERMEDFTKRCTVADVFAERMHKVEAALKEEAKRAEEHIPEWQRYQQEQIRRAMKQVEYLEQERDERMSEIQWDDRTMEARIIKAEEIGPVNADVQWPDQNIQQKALRLEPGVYVLECDIPHLSHEQKDQIRRTLERFKPHGIEFLVLERGMRIVREPESTQQQ